MKLAFGDFSSKSAIIFSNWLHENQFKDFTLSCKGGGLIGVHKSVLSARSGYFRALFLSAHSYQPFQYFEDVGLDTLKAVVDFIYLGDVEVPPHIVDDFLRFANILEIKEFLDNNDRDSKLSDKDQNVDNIMKEKVGIDPFDNDEKNTAFVASNYSSRLHILTEATTDCININPESLSKDILIDNKATNLIRQKEEKIQESETSEKTILSDDSNILPINEEKYLAMTSKLYTCDLCDFDTTSRRKSYYHKRKVHECLEYYCDQCAYSCTEPTSLKQHQKIKHEMVRYPCKQCNYVATSTYTLKSHVKNIHERLPVPCDQCEFVAETMSILKNHKESKHEDTIHSCPKCVYQTKIKSYMNGHMKAKHSDQMHYCKICGYKTRTQTSLYRHKKSTHEGIRYECDVENCDYNTKIPSRYS